MGALREGGLRTLSGRVLVPTIAARVDIASFLAHHARYRPDHPAVVFEEHRLTYAQFHARVNRLASAMLGLGVGQGQRVATLLPNCLELLEVYWATARIGAVVVPLSPLLLGPGLKSLLRDSGAVLLFTNAALRATVEEARDDPAAPAASRVLTDGSAPGFLEYRQLTEAAGVAEPGGVAVRGQDPYNVMYTSGTTGQPKGIVHTHEIRARYATLFANSWRMTPEAVVLHTGSIVFNGAFTTLMPCFYLGGTYVLHRQFEAEALIRTVEREKVTHTMMVPSQIVAMLASPAFDPGAMQSLQMILSLGAPLHREHKNELNRHFPGRFYELYGLTEGFLTILDRDDAIRKEGSVGVPPQFSEMRILREDGTPAAPGEVGEIVGRGPMLMPGYFGRPDLTAEAVVDGWLHTGDLGYLDADGYLFLVDRKKDMIDSGGVKVYPRDIEEVAVRHPLVQEAAVFGVPDDRWGEVPLAAVVLKRPGGVTAADLEEWINTRVAARFQRVREVVVMESFPRNAAGKVLKREMREPHWAGRARKI